MLNAHYDSVSAGIAAVSRNDFAQAIQYASNGLEIGKLQNGDYSYSIKAKVAGVEQNDIEAIENSQVWSSSQRTYIPFKQVSKGVELEDEETLIHRRDRVRTITISAEPGFDETAGKAFARIKPQIEALQLPDGYKIEWGGEYESSTKAQKASAFCLPSVTTREQEPCLPRVVAPRVWTPPTNGRGGRNPPERPTDYTLLYPSTRCTLFRLGEGIGTV